MNIDENILVKLATGSHQAFKEIYRTYYSRIHAFAHGLLKDADESDELTQMVFIKLWDKREIFQNVHNFDSYIFTLTKHTIFNYIEAKHTIPTTNDEIPDQFDNETPYDDLIAHDLQLLIDLIINNMPSQRQQIFRLSRVEGLSNEEIAIKLGIKKKTVENHLNLALKELRNIISITILIYIMLIN